MKLKLILFFFICLPSILPAQNRVFPFQKKGKWGVIDENNNIVKEPSFDKVSFFINHQSDNAISLVTQKSKTGLLDKNGKIIIPIKYDKLVVFNHEKNVRLILNSKVGVFNLETSKVGIPVIYDEITHHFDINLYTLKREGMYGISDVNHKIIIPIKYHQISEQFSVDGSSKFKAILDNQITIYDERGNILKTYKKGQGQDEDFITNFYMDPGEIINPPPLTPISLKPSMIEDGIQLIKTIKNKKNKKRIGLVKKGNLYGLINAKGSFLAPIEFKKIDLDGNDSGLFLLAPNNLYGWFSMEQNKIVLSPKYLKIELAKLYHPYHRRGRKIKNYFFLKTSETNGSFFDKKTGQVFDPEN